MWKMSSSWRKRSLRRVLQAWDVGRGVWVWSHRQKRREERGARGYGASIQPALGDATPGDIHVTSIMTGYYLISPYKGRARDFQRRTNDALPLIWYWRWHSRSAIDRDFYAWYDYKFQEIYKSPQNRYVHYAWIKSYFSTNKFLFYSLWFTIYIHMG